jgi:hypothetical protein
MRMIGLDLHARQQTVAMLDTGEVLKTTLTHQGNKVRKFYSKLPRPVGVGIEATGDAVVCEPSGGAGNRMSGRSFGRDSGS